MQNTSGGAALSIRLVAIIVVGVALIALKDILMPLAVAFFLVMLSNPLVNLLKRIRIPTGVSFLVILGITAVILFALGNITYNQVTILTREVASYERLFLADWEWLLRHLPRDISEELKVIEFKELLSASKITNIAKSTVGSVFNLIGLIFLTLLYMLFLLMENESFPRRLRRAFSEGQSNRIVSITADIQKQTETYMVGKTLISLATGVLFTIILWIFGVKMFLLWGILAFLLNYIPTLGSYIATLLPLAMAAFQPQVTAPVMPFYVPALPLPLPMILEMPPEHMFGPGQLALLAVCLSSVQIVIGNILEPIILGDSMNVSPLWVFLSLLLLGYIWGVPGMILSTLIIATIRIILENIDPLKPMAIMIGGKELKAGEESEKEPP